MSISSQGIGGAFGRVVRTEKRCRRPWIQALVGVNFSQVCKKYQNCPQLTREGVLKYQNCPQITP